MDAVHAQALAEDPTIFDYDTAHDLMQEQQRTAQAQGPAAAFTAGGHVGGPKEASKVRRGSSAHVCKHMVAEPARSKWPFTAAQVHWRPDGDGCRP